MEKVTRWCPAGPETTSLRIGKAERIIKEMIKKRPVIFFLDILRFIFPLIPV